ncbi:MAG: type 4a pilus biogenesis protein PilO, partial [Candidatus Omnitrophica bacterium]|nr:type 4a pilus biogenesis protein PilO [Candidatus Omnitrophota bacterium]
GSKEQIYYGVPILVKAECRYHQLGRFLNELERADRFMKISDIKIKARPDRPETLYIQLIIVTYVMS